MGPYPEAMRDFAAAFEIPCLDIFTMTQNYFSTFATRQARQYFLHLSKTNIRIIPKVSVTILT